MIKEWLAIFHTLYIAIDKQRRKKSAFRIVLFHLKSVIRWHAQVVNQTGIFKTHNIATNITPALEACTSMRSKFANDHFFSSGSPTSQVLLYWVLSTKAHTIWLICSLFVCLVYLLAYIVKITYSKCTSKILVSLNAEDKNENVNIAQHM